MNINKLGIIGSEKACQILGIKNQTFHEYIKKYKIPHVSLPNASVFLRSDIEAFQEGRKSRLKHRKK